VGTGLSVTEQEDNGWNILILISIVFYILFILCAMIIRMFATYGTLVYLVGARDG
jgi:hypothetical protein